MAETARLQADDQIVELPVVVGSEGEKALDIAKLRAETGYIALDPGYGNTGSCQSDITFIDGDAGILRYRGYAIEDLAEYSRFIEVAHLLIWGELPNAAQLDEFSALLTKHQMLREEVKQHFSLFPPNSPPMAVLSSVLNALSCYYPELLEIQDEETFHRSGRAHHVQGPHHCRLFLSPATGPPHRVPAPEEAVRREFSAHDV